jgi:hypothetical protein
VDCFATEAALAPPRELQRGSGGAAPSGVPGQRPWRGARGAEPPGKFSRKLVDFEALRANLAI